MSMKQKEMTKLSHKFIQLVFKKEILCGEKKYKPSKVREVVLSSSMCNDGSLGRGQNIFRSGEADPFLKKGNVVFLAEIK